jgi:hypothetical protein
MAKLKIVNSKVFIAGVDVSDYVTAVEPIYQAAGLVEVKVTFVDDPRIETLDSGQKAFHVVEALTPPTLIGMGTQVRVKDDAGDALADVCAPRRLAGKTGDIVETPDGDARAGCCTVSFDDETGGWSVKDPSVRPGSCWGIPLDTLERA